jgi:hypothetical protein
MVFMGQMLPAMAKNLAKNSPVDKDPDHQPRVLIDLQADLAQKAKIGAGFALAVAPEPFGGVSSGLARGWKIMF